MRLTAMSATITEAMQKAEDDIVGRTRLAMRELEAAEKARRDGLAEIESAYTLRVGKINAVLNAIVSDFVREED